MVVDFTAAYRSENTGRMIIAVAMRMDMIASCKNRGGYTLVGRSITRNKNHRTLIRSSTLTFYIIYLYVSPYR